MCYSRATMCFPFRWKCPLLKTPNFVCMLVFKNVVGCEVFWLFVLKLFTYYIWAEMQKFYCEEVHNCNVIFSLSVSKKLEVSG